MPISFRKSGYFSPEKVSEREWCDILRERCKNLSLSFMETQEVIDIQQGINYFYVIDVVNGSKKRKESSVDE